MSEQRGVVSIRGGLVLGSDVVSGAVIVRDGTIAEVRRGTTGDLPGTVYEAAYVAPGYIDIQVNGGFGADVDGSPEVYRVLSERLPQRGVTSYLPTMVSAEAGAYGSLIEQYEAAHADALPGAVSLGLHLEGPFISPLRKGAHRIEVIEAATADTILRPALGSSSVSLVTLAAEREGAIDAILQLCEAGIVVSQGHTDATYEQFMRGIDAGATLATHLYNAMRPFGHREPGPIGGALTDDRTYASIIADGYHVDVAALKLAVRSKGIDRMVLISDMIMASGMPPGTYDMGGRPVYTDGKTSKLADGTLAGVIATLDECVRNMVAWGVVPVGAAVRLATENPARLLGIGSKGRLVAGCDADIVLLDEGLHVTSTFIGGACVFGEGGRDG
jgi:N-acetylglucosamine-6-phosphate deacetylase